MYLTTVIPLKKGLQKESLSYFSLKNIALGSMVTVQIRKSIVPAIVIRIDNISDFKSDLKSANFELKKVVEVKGPSPFNDKFFLACEKIAKYSVSNTGVIIKNLLPKIFLENLNLLKRAEIIKQQEKEKVGDGSDTIKSEKLIFQTTIDDRLSFYRTLIREAFAKKESIFICVPTRYDMEFFRSAMSRGIEEYVFCFHSEIPKKKLIQEYNRAISIAHPILVIATGSFLLLERADIKTIILERESSDSYKQRSRPYLDIRTFIEILSFESRIKMIFADTLLRSETLSRYESGELGEINPPFFRLPEIENRIVVDMKEEQNHVQKKIKVGKEDKFQILSNQTKNLLKYAFLKKESVILYSLRKGLAPLTICNDCGHTLLCPLCATPVVLYLKKNKDDKTENRLFMCNKCGRRDGTEIRCPHCDSWNLAPLGIGTDGVYQEVKKLLPEAKIFQIDKEATPNTEEVGKIVSEFKKIPGSILIGTEIIFSHIYEKVNHSAIISFDGLLSIPSFNMTQKILHIIEKLHNITTKNLIVQTRIPENKILISALSGNVLPLYREDLREREQYGYPPFKRLIKLTFIGNRSETENARNFLDKTLEEYNPQVFSAFISKIKNKYITNTIIKIDPKLWALPTGEKTKEESKIESDLLERLYKLPPSFSINVDPEDLL